MAFVIAALALPDGTVPPWRLADSFTVSLCESDSASMMRQPHHHQCGERWYSRAGLWFVRERSDDFLDKRFTVHEADEFSIAACQRHERCRPS
jgi:hypothetical protein